MFLSNFENMWNIKKKKVIEMKKILEDGGKSINFWFYFWFNFFYGGI